MMDDVRTETASAAASGPDGAAWNTATVHDRDAKAAARRSAGRRQRRVPERVGEDIDGRYRVVQALGAGGMGAVWKAYDRRIERHVAVKELFGSSEGSKSQRVRFCREARACGRLKSERVLQVYDTIEPEDGPSFIVMEFLEGEELAELVRREGRLPWRRAARIVLELAEGLRIAHDAEVWHRDLKPSNIFLYKAYRGAPEASVKIIDFGMAAPLEADGSDKVTQGIVGTPRYMPPEYGRTARYDGRSDLYSVGIILYELLAGRWPYDEPQDSTPMGWLLPHVQAQPRRVPAIDVEGAPIPTELRRLVDELLRKDPAQRVQTAEDVVQRLTGLLRSVRVVRDRRGWVVAGLLAAALVGVGVVSAIRSPRAASPAATAVMPAVEAPEPARVDSTAVAGAELGGSPAAGPEGEAVVSQVMTESSSAVPRADVASAAPDAGLAMEDAVSNWSDVAAGESLSDVPAAVSPPPRRSSRKRRAGAAGRGAKPAVIAPSSPAESPEVTPDPHRGRLDYDL